jgi:hypothetical protein
MVVYSKETFAFVEQIRSRREQARQTRAAAEAAAVADRLPYYSGFLQSKEGKVWVRRLVVVRDDGPTPTLGVYDEEAADPPDRITLIRENKLQGTIEVDDYSGGTQDISGRFSLRRPKPRPNAFVVIVGDTTYVFEAASTAGKAGWLDMLRTYITRVGQRAALAAASSSALTPLGPLHRGAVHVYDQAKGGWVPRWLVLRDSVTPMLAFFDAPQGVAPPDGATTKPLADVALGNKVDVYDQMPQNDLVSLTLRKAEPRPHAFYLVVDDTLHAIDAGTAQDRFLWMDRILDFVMRYKLTGGGAPAVATFQGLPPYHGFLVVHDGKAEWAARLVYLRDGSTPTLSVYDPTAREPIDRRFLLQEIALVGYVDVNEYELPEVSALTFRAKQTPRPNAFTVLVNDHAYNFEAPSPEVKQMWLGKVSAIVEKYRLNENAPRRDDSSSQGSSTGSPMAARKQASGSKLMSLERGGATGEVDLSNLPEGVDNPFEEDYEAEFRNKLYTTAAAAKAKAASPTPTPPVPTTPVPAAPPAGAKRRGSTAAPATPTIPQRIAAPAYMERLPTFNTIELIPSYSGYLDIQEPAGWVARFCHVRDGPVPTLALYHAVAKDTLDPTLFVSDIPLVGYAAVRDVKTTGEPKSSGKTFRAKSAPRLNGFTLVVNDRTYSIEASSAEAKIAWVRRLASIIDKYNLTQNEPLKTVLTPAESAGSVRGGGATERAGRKSSRDLAAESAAAAAVSTAGAAGAAEEVNLDALPEGVINPLEDDHAALSNGNPVFVNQLFGRE